MKRILVLLFSIVTISSGAEIMNYGKKIYGVWWMTDLKKMMVFLGINDKYKNYRSAGYCLKVSEDETKGAIIFYNINKHFNVRIESTGDNKYKMIYKNKERGITLEKDDNQNNKYIWHFDDSTPYPRKNNELYNDDGVLLYDTVEDCLKDIENQNHLDQAESEMEDPDDLRESETSVQ